MENTVTKAWKVYGRDGHRQRESFHSSARYERENIIIEVENFDRTGTHKYSIIRITASNPEICDMEFHAQLSDGVFENSWTGWLEQIEGPYYWFEPDFDWRGYPTIYDWALIRGEYGEDGKKDRDTEEPVVFGNYKYTDEDGQTDLWNEWDDIDAAIEAELGFCPDYSVN